MTYTIDATGKKLGRLASEAANVLRGKNTPGFTPNELSHARVTIENADKISITEKKRKEKIYERYSGYPSGLKRETLARLATRRGMGEVVRRAVYGMLPKNKLRARVIKNLVITA